VAMKQILSYSIHNILKFQIIRDRKFDFSDLMNLWFSCFEVEQVEKPDIVLNIGKFVPANENCYLIDHKYHIKDNYFYCRESEGKASWEMEVIGFEHGGIIINFHVNKRFQINLLDLVRISLFLPQTFLLKAIEHKLSTKGYFLVHSGGVSKNNKAYLLCGRSGCFKTSLCMDFVRRVGFTWLGDDRAILYQNRVLEFPVNSAVFEFMTQQLPDETHLGFSNLSRFVAQHLLGKYRKTDKDGTRSAELKALLLITKSNRLPANKQATFEALPQSSLEQIVASLLISNRLEDFWGFMPSFGINSAPFLRYLLAYTFVFPNSFIAAQEKRLAESLRSNLEKIPIYKVEIPPVYNIDTFNQVHEFIVKNC